MVLSARLQWGVRAPSYARQISLVVGQRVAPCVPLGRCGSRWVIRVGGLIEKRNFIFHFFFENSDSGYSEALQGEN